MDWLREFPNRIFNRSILSLNLSMYEIKPVIPLSIIKTLKYSKSLFLTDRAGVSEVHGPNELYELKTSRARGNRMWKYSPILVAKG